MISLDSLSVSCARHSVLFIYRVTEGREMPDSSDVKWGRLWNEAESVERLQSVN